MLVKLNIMSWCLKKTHVLKYLQSHTGALLFVTCFDEPHVIVIRLCSSSNFYGSPECLSAHDFGFTAHNFPVCLQHPRPAQSCFWPQQVAIFSRKHGTVTVQHYVKQFDGAFSSSGAADFQQGLVIKWEKSL